MKTLLQQSRRTKALNRIYNLEHWNIRLHDKHAKIELLSKKDSAWETVAEINGPNSKILAEFLVFKIKAHDQATAQLEEAIYAVKLCLESGNLNWEAEQEAEAVLRKYGLPERVQTMWRKEK